MKALKQLVSDRIVWSDTEHHSDLCRLYEGEKRLVKADNGSYYDGGFTWGSTNLLIASKQFDASLEQVKAMKERWSNNVVPNIVKAEEYESKKAFEEDQRRAFDKDISEMQTDPKVIATENARADEVMKMYM